MINIDYTYPDWDEKIKKYKDEINLFIAAQVQTNRGMMFDAEGADNGKPRWAPLKFRNGMILQKRGNLRRSWAPDNPTGRAGPDGIVRFKEDVIVVGTSLAYARLMNDGTEKMPGGVLRPKSAKALMIPLPDGKALMDTAKGLKKQAKKVNGQNVIFRKSVKIPARPMDNWSQQDEDEISAALKNKIVEVLNR